MLPTEPTQAPSGATSEVEWQALPRRARALCMLTAFPLAVPFGFGSFALATVFDLPPFVTVPLGVLVGAALGAWFGLKTYRYTFWRLDDDGLAIRRGRMWQRETRVPASRVQHLDLKRGPLQRRRDLATLVVHTAGTRHSAVTVPHLDAGDAERLRDRLGRQIDHDDDA